MQKEFALKETQERVTLYLLEKTNKNIKVNTYTKTGSFYPYDAIITSGDTIEKEVVEIKRRNCLHTDYQGEFIIEKDRIERISKCAESFLYINFFNDNKMIIWKIDAFKDYEYITKKCNKKTAINIGQIDKKVLLLKTQDALCIEDLQFTKEEVERVALNHFNKKYLNI